MLNSALKIVEKKMQFSCKVDHIGNRQCFFILKTFIYFFHLRDYAHLNSASAYFQIE